jgi:hypothetical protein
MPRVMIKEFDYYQSQWLIFAAWMPYIATQRQAPLDLDIKTPESLALSYKIAGFKRVFRLFLLPY